MHSSNRRREQPEVAQSVRAQSPAPANDRDWIDPYTGHRIVRLSEEGGSTTFYFHNNSYTPEGDKLIFNTPSGLAAVEVAKIGVPDLKLEIVTQGGGANMAQSLARSLRHHWGRPWRRSWPRRRGDSTARSARGRSGNPAPRRARRWTGLCSQCRYQTATPRSQCHGDHYQL